VQTADRPTPPEALKARLRGPIAFPITPYAADGSVDVAAVRQNAAWLGEYGICAIVAPSGTGEIFGLSPDECAAVTAATVDAVAGRLPVIAAVGFNTRIGADLARRAEAAGADGVLVMPPYYATPDPYGLLAYFQQIAAATALGVMPYARDAAVFTPELIEQLARRLPNLPAAARAHRRAARGRPLAMVGGGRR
jgi:5-dehydro-4-deoxyglucarate dehydratase